ncbi:hypothetical protein KST_03570 [Mycobacterium marinum]|nr:hypothetical protein KST_03570 [Mycobacterium marinum]
MLSAWLSRGGASLCKRGWRHAEFISDRLILARLTIRDEQFAGRATLAVNF